MPESRPYRAHGALEEWARKTAADETEGGPELKKPEKANRPRQPRRCSVPVAQPSWAPEPSISLRVPENPQSFDGRVRLELGRWPSQNRSQAHDRTPVPSENDLVPRLCPSYKIGQTRFGFADRNIHRRRISSQPKPRRKSWSGPRFKSSQLATLRPPTRGELILGGLEARPRWPAPLTLPQHPSPSAHWSQGGARIRYFRLLPCARER